jgi:uncharacterized membrane protein YoaK (UPF0700 family)
MTGIRTRPESLGLAMLLTAVGGFLDAFTFVQHRVFANAQTGNVVLFTVDAANRDWSNAATRLPPIAAFIVGVAVIETLGVPSVWHALRRPLRVELGSRSYCSPLSPRCPMTRRPPLSLRPFPS